MSDTKWTPGRWVRCDAEMNAGASSHGWFVKVAPHRVISVEGRTSDEADANADLIAASPKMADYIRRKADDGCSEAQQIWTEITNAEG